MHLVDKDSVQDIMYAAFIEPSKSKGQNFLIDVEKAKNIVNLLKNTANSSVLEIGPGLGSLTYHLQEKCNNLTLLDVDDKIISYLSFEINEDVNLIHGDALKEDLSSYEYIISNIPYNITSLLIEHIMISASSCKQMVFMVQKENFFHFYDVEGSEYGPLSVLIHLLGNIKKAFDVGSASFYPRPKCTSTVFTIDMKEDVNREDAISTYRLAKKLFANRRKTILNNLSQIIGKEEAKNLLDNLGINPLLRPEQISPDVFLKINNTLSR